MSQGSAGRLGLQNGDSREYPRWSALVSAELVRVRATKGFLILALVAAALAALGSLTTGATLGKPTGIDPRTAQAAERVLASGFTAGLIGTIFAALLVTSEFRYRTAGQSIIDSGSRTRWFLAKLPAAVLVGVAYTVLGQTVTLAVGLPLLMRTGVHPDIWSGTLLRMSIGTVALGVPAALWGACLGLTFRSQIGTVVGLVVYSVFGEAAVLHYLPSIGRLLPGGAQAAIVSDPTFPYRNTGVGIAVFAFWILAAGAAGIARFNGADVGA